MQDGVKRQYTGMMTVCTGINLSVSEDVQLKNGIKYLHPLELHSGDHKRRNLHVYYMRMQLEKLNQLSIVYIHLSTTWIFKNGGKLYVHHRLIKMSTYGYIRFQQKCKWSKKILKALKYN